MHALPTCLSRPTFTRAVHESDLVSVILRAALDPLRVPTLLTLQSLGVCLLLGLCFSVTRRLGAFC